MPITFRTLKEDAVNGYRLGGYVSNSTPTSGNTTTSFLDPTRQEPVGTWDRVDSYVKFTTGTNDGAIRLITGYSANVVTFAPAVTASVPSGAGYSIFQNFHPDKDVGAAINASLRETFPNRTVTSIVTMNEQDGVYAYTVPSAAFNAVTKLTKIERSVGTTSSAYSFEPLSEGLHYNVIDYSGTGQLQIQYTPTPSLVLRLTAVRVASDLVSDTDTTDEPPAVVLAGARHFLALQEGNAELANTWLQKFEAAKLHYFKSRPSVPLKTPRIVVG